MSRYKEIAGVLALSGMPNRTVGSLSVKSVPSILPPDPPVENAVTNLTDVSFSANWSASATATGYKLYVYLSDGTTPVTGYNGLDVGNVVTYSVNTNLIANTTYKVQLKAYNSGGDSSFSNVITVITYDADAQAFITYNSITDPTLIAALNTFFLQLKTGPTNASNNWTPATNIKLPVFADSTKNAVDLKTPGTQNATFVGSPTHGSDGVALNGTTQYYKTGNLQAALNVNTNTKLAFYKTETSPSGFCAPISVFNTSPLRFMYLEKNISTGAINTRNLGPAMTNARTPSALTGLVGFGRKNSTTAARYVDNVVTETSNTVDQTSPAVETIVGAYANGASEFVAGKVQMSYEADGTSLTQSMYTDLIAAITNFKTTMGI